MKTKKPPPNADTQKERVRASSQKTKNPNSPVSVAPISFANRAVATKAKLNKKARKQKTRQLLHRNKRVFKDFCDVTYHDWLFLAKPVGHIGLKYHEPIIRIALALAEFYVIWHAHVRSVGSLA
jgi:hypothetical protein